MEEMRLLLREKDYLDTISSQDFIYRVVTHVEDWEMKKLPFQDILSSNLRRITLIRKDTQTGDLRYLDMPLARYFIPWEGKIIVGSIDSWEDDEKNQFRRFAVYDF
jgi:hypothetical protein